MAAEAAPPASTPPNSPPGGDEAGDGRRRRRREPPTPNEVVARVLATPADAFTGRTLPYDLEAEKGVLGCCLTGGINVLSDLVRDRIAPEAFFSPQYRVVFEGLLELNKQNKPPEIVLLADLLRAQGRLEAAGGTAALLELTGAMPTPIHASHYASVVREKYSLRQVIAACATAVDDCFASPVSARGLMEDLERKLLDVGQSRPDATTDAVGPVKEAVGVIMPLLTQRDRQQVQGVPTGFADLDRRTFGLHPGDMVVLAARPSMGKTSLALNIAEHAILPRRGTPNHTLFFSLEMTAASLAMRLICSRSGVDMTQLREGVLRDKVEAGRRVAAAADEFMKAPLKINDSSDLTIHEIRAIARRIHARQPLRFIVIDYLQLIKAEGKSRDQNREREVAEISRGVKGLAKDLGVPVLVLCQLNRAAEKENRTPRLSDLRESGSIEQDADVVMMLAPPAGKKDEEIRHEPVTVVDLLIAKQRNGQVGHVPLTFRKSLTRFEDHIPQPT